MFEIAYWELFTVLTAVMLAVSIGWLLRNSDGFCGREIRLILFYICIVVIFRFVYFPLHLVEGKIAPLCFDSSKIMPLWLNLVPLTLLKERYDGWLINVIGNILMFVPVGIVWPFCFKKLNSYGKAVLAGGGFSLFIELTQLCFYDRGTDIDDLILNTAGAAIGAAIYFLVKRAAKKKEASTGTDLQS